MADIQTTIKTALGGVGVPVFLGTWQGTEPPAQYITYTTRHHPTLYGSDAATEHEYTVYVEIWSETSYLTLKGTVTAAIQTAGFNLVEEVDVGDPDTNHLSQQWYGVI
ncbi:MAG: hypothetical protein PHX74_11560 [Candidatus Sumerlaeales bacterium]|nr:hypothetical protein [Candidatus Sumerlaeales bacterium]